jgi:hypothetical protein
MTLSSFPWILGAFASSALALDGPVHTQAGLVSGTTGEVSDENRRRVVQIGRSLNDDEMLGFFTFRSPHPVHELSTEEWDREMNEIIDSFPQSPLLSDDAVSRESIYTREDEML